MNCLINFLKENNRENIINGPNRTRSRRPNSMPSSVAGSSPSSFAVNRQSNGPISKRSSRPNSRSMHSFEYFHYT